jgi:hypothetical protein
VRLLASFALANANGTKPVAANESEVRGLTRTFAGEVLAELALVNGDTQAALRWIERDRAGHETGGRTNDWLAAEELRLRALVALGRAKEAAAVAQAALDVACERGAGRLAWRMRGSLSDALAELGSPEAASERKLAAREMMAVANTLPSKSTRDRFMAQPAAARLAT